MQEKLNLRPGYGQHTQARRFDFRIESSFLARMRNAAQAHGTTVAPLLKNMLDNFLTKQGY